MFPFCKESERLSANYDGALVSDVTINTTKSVMEFTLLLSEPAPPMEIGAIESILAMELGLASVNITAVYARAKRSATARKSRKAPPARTGSIIMGRKVSAIPIPMETVSLEIGKVAVSGEVCDVTSRYLEKRKAWILNFDITDYTGTIHVSKFLQDEDDAKIVQKVKTGMWLTVSGSLSISRYDDDLTLEPVNIEVAEKKRRLDTAAKKRVELTFTPRCPRWTPWRTQQRL